MVPVGAIIELYIYVRGIGLLCGHDCYIIKPAAPQNTANIRTIIQCIFVGISLYLTMSLSDLTSFHIKCKIYTIYIEY
jgi:hypothetical protein